MIATLISEKGSNLALAAIRDAMALGHVPRQLERAGKTEPAFRSQCGRCGCVVEVWWDEDAAMWLAEGDLLALKCGEAAPA